MNRLLFFVFVLTFSCLTTTTAQEIASSFRVGLSFASIPGPSEKGADGADLESFNTTTGFHVAGGAVFKFLENYGVKAELVYAQRGGTYEYSGLSTRIFQTTLSGNKVKATGTELTTLRVSNSYLEIPITGYIKVGKKIEFQAGASVSFLVGSKAVGDLSFNGTSNRDDNPVDLSLNLDYNYLKDEVFSTDVNELDPATSTRFVADGETVIIPNQLGAYFDYNTKDGNFFRGIDAGLHAGVSYFLSPGLFINFTAQFGLLDATNNVYDFSKAETNDLERVSRSDTDRNFNLQGSVGFSF